MPAHKDGLMTVGELARRVGVTVRTIQYYDQKGLLHPSSKSEQNQRLYSTDDEERLYRILTLKFLGFSLTQIKEAEGIDDCQKLSGALDHRMCELERESMEILRNINTISNLKEHLAASESVRWSDFAQAISDMQNREDVLWMAINGEGCDESSVPELTHEVIDRWHELMGDTIEAMHDGVQPRDERGRELRAPRRHAQRPDRPQAPRQPTHTRPQEVRSRLLRGHPTQNAQLPQRRARGAARAGVTHDPLILAEVQVISVNEKPGPKQGARPDHSLDRHATPLANFFSCST